MRRTLLLLACLTSPAAAQGADSLLLESPTARLVLHAADWAGLPRDTMRVQFHDQPPQLYSGVPLPALLKLVGVRTDSLRGRSLALRLVVEAADGYRVVLSLSELDPTLGGRRALLADRVEGQPLPPTEAPFRLLIAGDQRPSRWARQVVALRVRSEYP
jgi:DMSO/TMAO reductase YedYZ molybdopterin-dependent catalytic subunit